MEATFQFTRQHLPASNSVVDTLSILNNPPLEIVAGSNVTITVSTCPASRLVKFGIAIYNAN
jgi:hypothetical protein